MVSPNGKRLECGVVYNRCKDFLCPPESKISEWFQTATEARLRVKALDPYGNMKRISHQGTCQDNNLAIVYNCTVDSCHASVIVRYIQPDPEGNVYGLYGCFQHQHKLQFTKEKPCEIVFKNKKDAKECFEKNGFGLMYKTTGFMPKRPLSENYKCRRRALKKGLGHFPCKSYIGIFRTFKDHTLEKGVEMPFTLGGIFYHRHTNDERFHKKKEGGWVRDHDDPRLDEAKKKRNKSIRIHNGKIFPVYARKYVTMEEVLEATNNRPSKRSRVKEDSKFVKGFRVCTNKINLEEKMRNIDPLQ